MFPPPPKNTLRRMKLEELIGKIEQIEEQVQLTLHEYPRGHTIERQRLVLAIAKQIRAHLTDQLAAGGRKPVIAEAEPYLRVIEGEADRMRVAVLPEVSSGSK